MTTPTHMDLQQFRRDFPRWCAVADKLKPKAHNKELHIDPILAAAAKLAGVGLISYAMPEQESPLPLGMIYHDARALALHELRELNSYLYSTYSEASMDARADIAAGKFAVMRELQRIDEEMEAMAKGGAK